MSYFFGATNVINSDLLFLFDAFNPRSNKGTRLDSLFGPLSIDSAPLTDSDGFLTNRTLPTLNLTGLNDALTLVMSVKADGPSNGPLFSLFGNPVSVNLPSGISMPESDPSESAALGTVALPAPGTTSGLALAGAAPGATQAGSAVSGAYPVSVSGLASTSHPPVTTPAIGLIALTYSPQASVQAVADTNPSESEALSVKRCYDRPDHCISVDVSNSLMRVWVRDSWGDQLVESPYTPEYNDVFAFVVENDPGSVAVYQNRSVIAQFATTAGITYGDHLNFLGCEVFGEESNVAMRLMSGYRTALTESDINRISVNII